MAGDKEKALAAGCDEFDTKPVDMSRLLGKIEGSNLIDTRDDDAFCCSAYVCFWHDSDVSRCRDMSAAGVVSRRRESVMLYER
jgi:hypothetical protein